MNKIYASMAVILVAGCLAAGCSAGGRSGEQAGQTPAGQNNGAAGQTPGGTNGNAGANNGGAANSGAGEAGNAGGANEGAPDNGGGAANNGTGAGTGGPGGDNSGAGGQQPPSTGNQDDDIAQKVAGMSLDEKLGQMIIAGVQGTAAGPKDKALIEDEHVGGIIFYKDNLPNPASVVRYVNQLKEWNAANPEPLILSVDEEGGRVSRMPGVADLPTARSVGKAGDADYAAQIGQFLGEACSAMGINVDFAPVLDINSNPNNPVIGDRSYGATAELVASTGLAVMGGIKTTGVIPVVKHFPGHGDTSVDSHLELPVVNKTLKQLQSFEWQPFKQAIDAGTDVVMIAHILFPKLDADYPASLSKTIVTDELRGTLGFKGVVITDDLGMGAIADHYGMGEAAVQAVKAGGDLMLAAHGYDNVKAIVQALKASIAKGEIAESRIDESVARIIALKEKYGVSDDAVASAPDLSGLNKEIREAVASH